MWLFALWKLNFMLFSKSRNLCSWPFTMSSVSSDVQNLLWVVNFKLRPIVFPTYPSSDFMRNFAILRTFLHSLSRHHCLCSELPTPWLTFFHFICRWMVSTSVELQQVAVFSSQRGWLFRCGGGGFHNKGWLKISSMQLRWISCLLVQRMSPRCIEAVRNVDSCWCFLFADRTAGKLRWSMAHDNAIWVRVW